jgi:multimeric flavodoxin WrbA
MKVIAFNGSAQKDGNTAMLLHYVLDELQAEGIETELFQLAGKEIRGCTACRHCFKNQDKQCAIDTDILNECLGKMLGADGILLGSPTYFSDVTAEMKALIDRAGYVARANNHILKYKVGAAVVVARRAGSMHAFDTMNHFFLVNQLIVPGSSYWNIGIGKEKGDVEQDKEGIETMKVLGRNMAWLLRKTRG